jgi:hypothetical protein
VRELRPLTADLMAHGRGVFGLGINVITSRNQRDLYEAIPGARREGHPLLVGLGDR